MEPGCSQVPVADMGCDCGGIYAVHSWLFVEGQIQAAAFPNNVLGRFDLKQMSLLYSWLL